MLTKVILKKAAKTLLNNLDVGPFAELTQPGIVTVVNCFVI